MYKINTLLVSISAKSVHKQLAPWCLKAFADAHCKSAEISIFETSVNENIATVLSEIVSRGPAVAGFSCYIWNIEAVKKFCEGIKNLLPDCKIVLGGPEITADFTFPYADEIICGGGEVAFCNYLLALSGEPPLTETFCFADFHSSFTEDYFRSFGDFKIENRLVYYESSRGCPFKCAFCLSGGAECGVFYLPLDRVKSELLLLVNSGAKIIKFVDRTFNADKKRALEILLFIESLETDATFHFEAAGDLFDENLISAVSRMPKGRVQFEIGIQSFNEKTLAAVSRRTDLSLSEENIRKLASCGNCHIHLDLIAGLPFDSLSDFKRSFDKCIALAPDMLQLGFLKLLHGTKMRAMADESGDFAYNSYPPYEVQKSDSMSSDDLQSLKRIEPALDKYYNTGMFKNSIAYGFSLFQSSYDFFDEFSRFCGTEFKRSLKNAYTLLFDFLREKGDFQTAAHYIKLDQLSNDPKGLLPDGIERRRQRDIELLHKGKYQNCRAEFFPFDNKTRLFVYDKKPYEIIIL